MKLVQSRTTAAAGLAAVAILGMSACSSSEEDTATSPSPTTTDASPTADPAANLVGSGCEGYAAQVPEGAGSVSGMAKDPVTVAASNNPLLKTLTSTVSGKYNPGVNLVDTLNGGEFTVIAPTDDAFAKLPPATLEQLKTDAPLLNSILTYHVIPDQLDPTQVVGTKKSVQGADVNVTGTGPNLKFNESGLVCGGVQTANATVYMVDTVMMPPTGAPAPADGGAAPGAGTGPGGAPGAGAGAGPGGATAQVPGAGAGAGPGGATATAPGAGAGAGPGGATAQVPGAGAGAGPGGAGVQVPGGGATAGPGGVCIGPQC